MQVHAARDQPRRDEAIDVDGRRHLHVAGDHAVQPAARGPGTRAVDSQRLVGHGARGYLPRCSGPDAPALRQTRCGATRESIFVECRSRRRIRGADPQTIDGDVVRRSGTACETDLPRLLQCRIVDADRGHAATRPLAVRPERLVRIPSRELHLNRIAIGANRHLHPAIADPFARRHRAQNRRLPAIDFHELQVAAAHHGGRIVTRYVAVEVLPANEQLDGRRTVEKDGCGRLDVGIVLRRNPRPRRGAAEATRGQSSRVAEAGRRRFDLKSARAIVAPLTPTLRQPARRTALERLDEPLPRRGNIPRFQTF